MSGAYREKAPVERGAERRPLARAQARGGTVTAGRQCVPFPAARRGHGGVRRRQGDQGAGAGRGEGHQGLAQGLHRQDQRRRAAESCRPSPTASTRCGPRPWPSARRILDAHTAVDPRLGPAEPIDNWQFRNHNAQFSLPGIAAAERELAYAPPPHQAVSPAEAGHGLLVQPVVLADPGGRQAADAQTVPGRPERAPAGRRGRLRARALAEQRALWDLDTTRPPPPFQRSSFVVHPSSVDVDILKSENPRLALAAAVAERMRFHHWELAFPEVFAERGGFDLIVGNPPWVLVELE